MWKAMMTNLSGTSVNVSHLYFIVHVGFNTQPLALNYSLFAFTLPLETRGGAPCGL